MFPGNPHDHSPCSSTPAGPSTRYGTKGQRTRHGPRTKAQRGLPTVANFGAQSHGFWSRCLRLEVEVTRHRARLASGCWSQLCRTGFDPQGFYERFLNWNSSSFPELHGASFVLALFYRRQLRLFNFTTSLPHAGTSGLRSCENPPPLATACHRPPPTAELRKIEWARYGRADPLSYYAPNQAIPADKSNHFSSLPPTNRWPFSRGMRRSTPAVRGVPA